jgi:hypothetical protein
MLKKILFISLSTIIIFQSSFVIQGESVSVSPKKVVDKNLAPQESKELIKEKNEKNYYSNLKTESWETDLEGNIINRDNLLTGGSYWYDFVGVEMSSTQKDTKHYFLGESMYNNYTSQSVPLTYKQNESKTSEWGVTASISGTGEIKVAWLAKLEVEVGVEGSYSVITSSSSEVLAGPVNVLPKTGQKFVRTRTGAYGSGSLKYIKYYYDDNTQTNKSVGYYYEAGSGWTPVKNSTTISQYEYKL